ncbi:MAG: permease prefix domain 1-containing protein [Bryobacteraceae bacterium]|jgi:hypothetical protein
MYWRRESLDADLERELRSDIELEAEEQRENGLSPEAARYTAERAFGNTALVAEQVREAWGYAWISQAFQDLRVAVRLLGRNRGGAPSPARRRPGSFSVSTSTSAWPTVWPGLDRHLGSTQSSWVDGCPVEASAGQDLHRLQTVLGTPGTRQPDIGTQSMRRLWLGVVPGSRARG